MNIILYKNKKIYCIYFKKILYKSKNIYIPGLLGIYIKNNISNKAWILWIINQTKIINEFMLNTNNYNDKQFLIKKMIKFLFK